MANIFTPSPEQVDGFEEWKKGRPPIIQEMANRFPPWKLFRMKSTGHRVHVVSFGERADGTVTLTVSVDGRFNRVIFSRQVFGVDPDGLEECDLPAPDEDVGDTAAEAGYTVDDIENILFPEMKKHREKNPQNPPTHPEVSTQSDAAD